MTTLLLIITIVLLAATLYLLNKVRRYKRKVRMYRTHETFQPGVIKAVPIEEFDPGFAVGQTGPSPATAFQSIPSYKVIGSIDDIESWILCNFSKTAKRVFEFGTCTGKTAYLMALNAPPDARITTLTLGPEQIAQYATGKSDDGEDTSSAINESVFDKFFYTGTPVASKIEQLFADSKHFDETPYAGQFDLIFVDGSHAKSYVESDSQKALRMVKPGGIVLWHDYRGPERTQGVFLSLNELEKKIPLVHIKHTCLVAYRRPL